MRDRESVMLHTIHLRSMHKDMIYGKQINLELEYQEMDPVDLEFILMIFLMENIQIIHIGNYRINLQEKDICYNSAVIVDTMNTERVIPEVLYC